MKREDLTETRGKSKADGGGCCGGAGARNDRDGGTEPVRDATPADKPKGGSCCCGKS